MVPMAGIIPVMTWHPAGQFPSHCTDEERTLHRLSTQVHDLYTEMGSFQMQRVRKEAEVRSTEGTEEQSSRVGKHWLRINRGF